MIKLIWAMDINGLIGANNKIPWHIPKDLAYFKKMTKDKSVLMGDQTYFSLKEYYKEKPLPFGKIYVATLKRFFIPDVVMVSDADSFLKENKEELFVIGGAQIYNIGLKYADILYITYVLGQYQGDCYFPKFDISKFKLVEKSYEQSLIFTKYKRL